MKENSIEKENHSEPTREKENVFSYSVTKFDSLGWARADRAFPIPFDIVLLQTDRKKRIPGWWDQTEWKGLRLKKGEKVIKWKRRMYERD